MKSYLAIGVVVVVLVGLVSTGGCVSRAEYDTSLAACRRANEEAQKSQAALQAAQADKAALDEKLADMDRTVQTKQAEISLLESANADLQKDIDNLRALYEKGQATDLPPLVLLPGPVDAALRGFAGENSDLVEYMPRYGMVKFKADFTFDPGSEEVAPSAIEAIGKLVGILNSSEAGEFNVYIAGHTDDIPILKPATSRRHPTNWYLSVHRAVEVQKELVKAGLGPRRIAAMGFGEYHPVVPNLPNKKGNAKNRRVEIWIVPPDRFLTQPQEVLGSD